MLIYLIGYMGSGKTTIGKKLAAKLNYAFVDLDAFIEQEQQKTVPQLFKEKGELAFRQIEKTALQHTYSFKNTVISTGGGTPCFFNNIEQINKNGLSVYIYLSAKALVSRLADSKKTRPLLVGKTDSDLLQFVSESLDKRLCFYEQAKLKVQGLGLTPDILADQIKTFLKLS